MKQTYSTHDSKSNIRIAVADLHPHMGGWRISRIEVPTLYRGKGHGTALLKRICDNADREGVVLYLEPTASSGGLTQTNLVRWYRRHSFDWDTEYLPHTYTRHHRAMVRYPQ